MPDGVIDKAFRGMCKIEHVIETNARTGPNLAWSKIMDPDPLYQI